MDRLRIKTTIPLDRARTFAEIAKLAGMNVPKPKAPATKPANGDDVLVKQLRDALLKSAQAKQTLSTDALLAKMTAAAAALYPELTREQAFAKAARENPEIRSQYIAYKKVWLDELPAREAAIEKHREVAAIKKRDALANFEASQGAAYQALVGKAEQLRKADLKLTKEQAFTKAARENPNLWRRYREESRAA